jgi:N-acyl amino acid synthase of PEP-CTERM/exosortase system
MKMSSPIAVRSYSETRDGTHRMPASNLTGPRLKDLYDSYFEVVLAETEEQRQAAFRLRYEVYCVEHPYEDPAQNPSGIETDAYDAGSLHALLLHRPTQSLMGTVRLILPRFNGKDVHLPIRNVCRHELIAQDNEVIPRANTAEISRLAISKTFRRRAHEETSVGNITMSNNDPRRRIPNTSLGLMQAIAALSAKAGVSHLCAVMDPVLLRLLRRLGIYFIDLGPEVEYHGSRQPCYSHIDTQGVDCWLERPEVWELLTQDGTQWPLNTDLLASRRTGAQTSQSGHVPQSRRNP